MQLRGKLIIALVILAVLDMVVPIPFMALMLLYVVLEKPAWFQKRVSALYRT